MVKVGIAGGSGYGGTELVHILLRHPQTELTWISSEQHAGEELEAVHPHLRGFLDVRFSPLNSLNASDLDVLFLALPSGEALKLVPALPPDLKVIDLSGDFRIADAAVFEQFYHLPLNCPDVQKDFVYGLTELNREKIRSSKRVANPGCFATATVLALYPLFQEGCIEAPVFVDTKTGSSGAGRSMSSTTHHPRRTNSFFAYKPFQHQHLPEIAQALYQPCQSLVLQTHSAPFVRGIFATHYTRLLQPLSLEAVAAIYAHQYGEDFFIRWSPQCPDVNFVRHSNFVDIGVATKSNVLIVWSVLDNLQKGAAGQAVQNMNVMCGFPEQMALDQPPVHP